MYIRILATASSPTRRCALLQDVAAGAVDAVVLQLRGALGEVTAPLRRVLRCHCGPYDVHACTQTNKQTNKQTRAKHSEAVRSSRIYSRKGPLLYQV